MAVRPDSAEAGEPTGFELELRVPQQQAADGVESAALREVALTMPPGVRCQRPRPTVSVPALRSRSASGPRRRRSVRTNRRSGPCASTPRCWAGLSRYARRDGRVPIGKPGGHCHGRDRSRAAPDLPAPGRTPCRRDLPRRAAPRPSLRPAHPPGGHLERCQLVRRDLFRSAHSSS
jgi:hypothetical protein